MTLKYNDYRRQSREIKAGGLIIGGKAPISVQSMTNTDTHDVEATYRQTLALAEAGALDVREGEDALICGEVGGHILLL